jgi:hypothetical protein
MVPASVLAVLLWLAGPGAPAAELVVGGETSCPAPAEVQAAVGALLPGPALTSSARVELRRERRTVPSPDAASAVGPGAPGTGPEELVIELRGQDGGIVASRRLPVQVQAAESCADLATAAAVVISSWLRELQEGGQLALELSARAAPAAARAAVAPGGPGYDLGAGFAAALAGSSFAAGGRIDGAVAPGPGRFAVRLAFLGTGQRSVPLAGGQALQALWTRLAFAVGPRVRFHPGPLVLEGHVEALGAVLLLQGGQNVPMATGATVFDPGVGGGVRLGYPRSRWLPFVDVSVMGWPQPQTVAVHNASASAEVPRFEVLLTAGVAFGNRW